MPYTFTPIGTVRSPYGARFGIPRQPDLVTAAKTQLVLEKHFTADSVRGLAEFDYIWVQFVFHAAEGWSQTVRPPRLGGNRRVGVFASRSPHRPNPIGLSLLRLESVGAEAGRVVLYCGGSDLLDGTPVLDIKPYIPFVEAKADAAAGFAAAPPPVLAVRWLPESGAERLPPELCALVEQSLAQDPRPAYQHDKARLYAARFGAWDVRFRVDADGVAVVAVESC